MGGSAYSPRNRCTALTASTSSTTSEKTLNSFVHARACAATVLAPRHLATLQERAGGAGRAGVRRRAGDSSLLPAQPQPSPAPGPPPILQWAGGPAFQESQAAPGSEEALKNCVSHEQLMNARHPLWLYSRDCCSCTDPRKPSLENDFFILFVNNHLPRLCYS